MSKEYIMIYFFPFLPIKLKRLTVNLISFLIECLSVGDYIDMGRNVIVNDDDRSRKGIIYKGMGCASLMAAVF